MDDSMKQFSIQHPCISYARIMEDVCRGVVYWTVLYAIHLYLVSLRFAVLLSLHLVKF